MIPFLLVIACLFSTSSFAQSSFSDTLRISINDFEFERKKYDFTSYLSVLTDSAGTWTIDNILSDAFQDRFQKDSLNLLGSWASDMGPDIKAIWARLTIRSELEFPLNWLINISAGNVELFVPADSGIYGHKISGVNLPMSDRYFQAKYGNLACLPLEVPPNSSQTLYFKLTNGVSATIGNWPLTYFNCSLFAPETYFDFDRNYRFFQALILGIMLAVAFYHLIIFLFNRKWVFLFFSLFVLTYSMVFSAFNGYASEFLFPGAEKSTFGLVFVAISWTVTYIFFYLFSRSYLRLKDLLPTWDKIWEGLVLLRIVGSIILISTVISAGSLFEMEKNIFFFQVKILGVISMLMFVVPIIVSIGSLVKGNKPAWIYLLAMTIFIYQQLVAEINFSTSLEVPYFNLGDLGIVVTVLLFSLGIAKMIQSLERKKTVAEQSQILLQAEADKVKAMDEFKTRFYTNITHEFRTPLTIILGMAEQVKNQPAEWFSEGLKMIKRNGQKLLNLTNQMLDLSKLEANVMPVNFIQDDIVVYLKYLVESFHSLAGAKNIRL